MHMRMMQQILAPGVEDEQKSDLRSQVPGVSCDFQ